MFRLGTLQIVPIIFVIVPIVVRHGSSGDGSRKACPYQELDHDGGGKRP